MADLPPRLFDRPLHRARLDRAAPGYPAADFLKARVAEDVAWRLSAILRRFPLAVDLSARSGVFARKLWESDAAAQVDTLVEADLSAAMFHRSDGRGRLRLVADEERLPFAPQSFDLVVSLLSLHWTNDLVGALVQARRVLKPDGLFIATLYGGATLTELRQSLLQAEAELSDGAGPRVSPFADALDAAGLLQRAGFALPVSDVDRITVRYAHPLRLMAELRAMGEASALADRPRRPLSRRVLARTSDIYAERFGLEDGRVPATFELITLTGWAPHASQPKALKPGSAKMRLADALGVPEQPLARG
ncbi:methyltransferase domain-containing protein [Caulobacter sp. S45]|uniref:methyltransferase domain-containing protein n=1 Tax=Caulobacter sp. S45 TaxID=1641861 RepID=UPI0015776781|nr:methyltransferase domain-containing protein [Caulobacter sp. S45]